jgi:hypothetical protein
MPPSSRCVRDDGGQSDDAAAVDPPLVKIGATEEELAPSTVLVCGNRALGSKLSQRVSVDTQILGSITGVKPLDGAVGRGRELGNDRYGNLLREILDESIED